VQHLVTLFGSSLDAREFYVDGQPDLLFFSTSACNIRALPMGKVTGSSLRRIDSILSTGAWVNCSGHWHGIETKVRWRHVPEWSSHLQTTEALRYWRPSMGRTRLERDQRDHMEKAPK